MHRKFLVLAFSLILIAISLIMSISVIFIVDNLQKLPLKRSYQTLKASTTTYPHPLKLMIKLDKTQFRLGENINMRLSLINLENKSITIIFSGGYPSKANLDYIVEDGNGNEIFRWQEDRGVTGALYYVTLGPGEEVNQTMIWDQRLSYHSNYEQVPSGIYSIRGATALGFKIGDWSTGPYIEGLKTPSLTFIIQ